MKLRRYCVSSSYCGPQTARKSVRCVMTLPALMARYLSTSYSVGVKWTSAPSVGHLPPLEVDGQATSLEPRSPSRATGALRNMPQRHTDACD